MFCIMFTPNFLCGRLLNHKVWWLQKRMLYHLRP
jgi:hypothetical protein